MTLNGPAVEGSRRMTRVAHVPVVSYRLQLHAGFTFSEAEALVPYLAALGVTHCYTSPVSTAMPSLRIAAPR